MDLVNILVTAQGILDWKLDKLLYLLPQQVAAPALSCLFMNSEQSWVYLVFGKESTNEYKGYNIDWEIKKSLLEQAKANHFHIVCKKIT